MNQEIAESPLMDLLHLQVSVYGQIPYTAGTARRHHYLAFEHSA